MFNSAPNKYYLPPEFNLRKKVMQIYDDKIIVTDRPDFSYDHVWKPFVFIGIYLISFFFTGFMNYVQIAITLIAFFESLKEPDNRLTNSEAAFLIFQRLIAVGLLFFFDFKIFLGYVLLTEICFHLRLKFLKREEPSEFNRADIQSITFKKAAVFRGPVITISYFDHQHSLKMASYTFSDDRELDFGRIKLAETNVVLS